MRLDFTVRNPKGVENYKLTTNMVVMEPEFTFPAQYLSAICYEYNRKESKVLMPRIKMRTIIGIHGLISGGNSLNIGQEKFSVYLFYS